MFSRTARYYDKLYSIKDYQAASTKLCSLITARHPRAVSLLDVGCGTGRHLEVLKNHYDVEGLDLDPALLEVARVRCPGVPFHAADMTNFSLDHRFDVITCLFSAIAYVQTIERVEQTVLTMRQHLNPGGLLFVEPWFSPENYWQGQLTGNFYDEPDLKIAWIYLNDRQGNVAILDIFYTVGTPNGVEQFREVHRMGLFTKVQYTNALTKAGFNVEHDPEGLFQRGLFIGRLAE